MGDSVGDGAGFAAIQLSGEGLGSTMVEETSFRGGAAPFRQSVPRAELWALQQPLAVPSAISPGVVQPAGSDGTVTPMQQLVAHWKLLHPASDVGTALCVRCGAGDAPSCRFHPDARAFAFGTGRFDYGYTSLWDTPHDRWLCCGGIAPECAGCCEEQNHSTDPDWWRAYDHLSPALASDRDSSGDSSSDSERSSDAAEAMSAMDIT